MKSLLQKLLPTQDSLTHKSYTSIILLSRFTDFYESLLNKLQEKSNKNLVNFI